MKLSIIRYFVILILFSAISLGTGLWYKPFAALFIWASVYFTHPDLWAAEYYRITQLDVTLTVVQYLCVPILFTLYMSIGDTLLKGLRQIDIRPPAIKTLIFALAGVAWTTFLFFLIILDPARAFLVMGEGDPLFPASGVPTLLALTLLLIGLERLTYRYIQRRPQAAPPRSSSQDLPKH